MPLHDSPCTWPQEGCVCVDLIIYECGICDCYHPWNWDGDCRDDSNRYSDPDEYAERNNLNIYAMEIRSMDGRVAADERGE